MGDAQSTNASEPRAVRILTKSRARNAARANRRRRTANNPGGPRTHRVDVKLTPEEKTELLELAAIADVTPARLLREAVFAAEIPVSPDEFRELVHELFRVQNALRSIGTNLNQIAKAVNATHEHGDQADELARVYATVTRYADRASTAIEVVTRW
ncbi:plasmid mobilization protein [Nocardia sp. NPDC004260]